jgi:hypothetical protein
LGRVSVRETLFIPVTTVQRLGSKKRSNKVRVAVDRWSSRVPSRHNWESLVIPARRQALTLWAGFAVALAAGAALWVFAIGAFGWPICCGVAAWFALALIQLWRCAARASLLRTARHGGER